jgi:hypothetical protein
MDEVAALTILLRENKTHSFWDILRNILTENGIDYSKSYLAFSTEEDDDNEFGVILTPDKTVFKYDILLTDNGKMLAEILVWQDISKSYESSPYHRDIKSAIKLMETDLKNS